MQDFRFSHVMLWSEKLTELVDWYQSKLGFEPRFPVSEHYASFRHSAWNMRLDIHPCEPGEKSVTRGAWIYLHVEDLDAAVAELAAAGIDCDPIQDEPNIPRHTRFLDPQGNVWGLEEEFSFGG